MKSEKIAIVLITTILFLAMLSSISASATCNGCTAQTGTRADDNAQNYILLDIAKADREQEISPTETATYKIIVRNLGDEDIYYYPPSPESFNLPDGWEIAFNPNDELFILGDLYGYLEVNFTAPANAEADSLVEVEIEGTTSNPEAQIITCELITSVNQIYDTSISVPDNIILESPSKTSNFEINIINNGNGKDWIALEVTNIPNGLDLSLELQELIILADSTEKVTITMEPDSILTAGDYGLNFSLYRISDSSKTWVSSQELVVEVVYYPDLSISSTGDIELSKYTPINGEDVTINITIHNIGDSDARNITVKVKPVTKSGSHREDIDDIVIDFLGLDNSTTIQIPWQATPPAVNKLLVLVDPENTIGELDEENNNAEYNIYIIRRPSDDNNTAKPKTGDYSLIQLSAVGIIALLSGLGVAAILSTESGKFGLYKLAIPFYTRVKREEVLNHEVRELVYDYVKTHPGEHFRAILTKLGLTNGTLVHHLHTLERQNFIKSERDGPFKRFYPSGRQLTEDILEINGIQKKILDAVTANPGMRQKDLSIQLHTSPPTINYHVKALSGVRLLNIERDGKNTHCFPGQSLNGWFKSGRVS